MGARLAIQIITNGTLMTPDVIRRLTAVGLKLRAGHDRRRRVLARPHAPRQEGLELVFRDVADNVLDCLPRWSDRHPGGDYTDANLHGFLPLLERMKRDGVDPARIPRVKFKPVLNGLGLLNPTTQSYDSCTWSNARPDVQIALGDAVRAFGFTSHDHLDLGPCAIHQINHYSTGPDGALYKCPGFLGRRSGPPAASRTAPTRATPNSTDSRTRARVRRVLVSAHVRRRVHRDRMAARAALPEGVNCEQRYFDYRRRRRAQAATSLPPDTLDRENEALEAIRALPGTASICPSLRHPKNPPRGAREVRRRSFQIRSLRRPHVQGG